MWLFECLSIRVLYLLVFHAVEDYFNLEGLKMSDMKMTDQIAGHKTAANKIAGGGNAIHEIAKHLSDGPLFSCPEI